jgi:hypothetical protein
MVNLDINLLLIIVNLDINWAGHLNFFVYSLLNNTVSSWYTVKLWED